MKNLFTTKIVNEQKNYLGMFNLVWGLGLTALIIFHVVLSVSSFSEMNWNRPMIWGSYAVIVAFAMINGYNYKPDKKIGKAFIINTKQVFSKYIIIGLFTGLFVTWEMYLTDWPGQDAIVNMNRWSSLIASFFMGNFFPLPPCGEMVIEDIFFAFPLIFAYWIVFAFWIIKNFFNVIFKISNEWVRAFIIFAISGGFVYMFNTYQVFWLPMKGGDNRNYLCFCQAFYVMPFVYIGYLVKKFKMLTEERGIYLLGYIVLALASYLLCGIAAEDNYFTISETPWAASTGNLFLGMFVALGAGLVLMRLSVGVSRLNLKFLAIFERIGAMSTDVLVVHEILFFSIPNMLIFKVLENSIGHGLALLALIAVHFALIYAGLEFWKYIRKHWN